MKAFLIEKLNQFFKLPLTSDLNDLDSDSATLLHVDIIRSKPFLRKIYVDFYRIFAKSLGDVKDGFLVELGSGGGFLKEVIPSVHTSDVKKLPNVDLHFSAFQMPFHAGQVNAFLGLDVLHHLSDIRKFFGEMDRCLSPQGKAVFIEPANTLWSRFVYRRFHHEAFEPQSKWEFDATGPMSSANGALPWIVFMRDRHQFEKEFPRLKIRSIKMHTPFRYLISGGVSFRSFLPSSAYGLIKALEWLLAPLNKYCGMFMTIELEKV